MPSFPTITALHAAYASGLDPRELNDRDFEYLLLEDCCGATDRGNHDHAVEMVKMQSVVFGAVPASATFCARLT